MKEHCFVTIFLRDSHFFGKKQAKNDVLSIFLNRLKLFLIFGQNIAIFRRALKFTYIGAKGALEKFWLWPDKNGSRKMGPSKNLATRIERGRRWPLPPTRLTTEGGNTATEGNPQMFHLISTFFSLNIAAPEVGRLFTACLTSKLMSHRVTKP